MGPDHRLIRSLLPLAGAALLAAACGQGGTSSAPVSPVPPSQASVVIGIPQATGDLDLRVVPLTGGGKPHDAKSLHHGSLMAAQGPLVLLSDDTSNLTLIDLAAGTTATIPVGLGTSFAPRAAFSPDGTKVAFASRQAQASPQLQILDVASHSVTALPTPAKEIGPPRAWTSKGIAVIAAAGVVQIDPSSGAATTVIPAPTKPVAFELSADASMVAVSTHTNGLQNDSTDTGSRHSGNTLTLMRAGGSKPVQLRRIGGHNMTPLAVAGDGTVLVNDEPAPGAVQSTDYGLLLVHPDASVTSLEPLSPQTHATRGLFTDSGAILVLAEAVPQATPTPAGVGGGASPTPAALLRFAAAGKKPDVLDQFQTIAGLALVFGGS